MPSLFDHPLPVRRFRPESQEVPAMQRRVPDKEPAGRRQDDSQDRGPFEEDLLPLLFPAAEEAGHRRHSADQQPAVGVVIAEQRHRRPEPQPDAVRPPPGIPVPRQHAVNHRDDPAERQRVVVLVHPQKHDLGQEAREPREERGHRPSPEEQVPDLLQMHGAQPDGNHRAHPGSRQHHPLRSGKNPGDPHAECVQHGSQIGIDGIGKPVVFHHDLRLFPHGQNSVFHHEIAQQPPRPLIRAEFHPDQRGARQAPEKHQSRERPLNPAQFRPVLTHWIHADTLPVPASAGQS